MSLIFLIYIYISLLIWLLFCLSHTYIYIYSMLDTHVQLELSVKVFLYIFPFKCDFVSFFPTPLITWLAYSHRHTCMCGRGSIIEEVWGKRVSPFYTKLKLLPSIIHHRTHERSVSVRIKHPLDNSFCWGRVTHFIVRHSLPLSSNLLCLWQGQIENGRMKSSFSSKGVALNHFTSK